MLLSFAVQALSSEYIARVGEMLPGGVYDVPAELDEMIAGLKLASLGITIDTLTAEQEHYMTSWDIGT
ncbi:adenosylhomocysteinase [Methanoculleus frigidifontis]|uniref:adenosylhomocysteinase n=1 Tax=Methanoculleus frigidifontis TaxID=2584085 RepID=UPI002658C589|nr:adenosylhomocysteinase [Methanoculleus sp. FWC-SCC1]